DPGDVGTLDIHPWIHPALLLQCPSSPEDQTRDEPRPRRRFRPSIRADIMDPYSAPAYIQERPGGHVAWPESPCSTAAEDDEPSARGGRATDGLTHQQNGPPGRLQPSVINR